MAFLDLKLLIEVWKTKQHASETLRKILRKKLSELCIWVPMVRLQA